MISTIGFVTLKVTHIITHNINKTTEVIEKTNKTHFSFPREFLYEIDRLVGRKKRSRFVVEATKEKLTREKFANLLKDAVGCWTDKKHSELRTKKDVDKYVRSLRKSWTKRLKWIYG